MPSPFPGMDPYEDAVLDLPAVFDRTYDISGFEDLVDYRAAPPAPLGDEELAWLDAHLLEKGFRVAEA